jgi:ribokinase
MTDAGRLIVVGSLNVDRTLRCPHLPAAGETVVASDSRIGFGGKGANQAVAGARLGAPTILIGALGSDADADAVLHNLRDEGVRTDWILRSDVPTGTALVLLDDAGLNCIVIDPGANSTLSGPAVRSALVELRLGDLDVVLVSGEVSSDCAEAAAVACREHGTRLVFNTAPVRPGLTWIAHFRPILIANEVEICQLTEEAEFERAILASAGLSDLILVTRGAEGVTVIDRGERLDIATTSVRPVDTTGAGDAFCGAFAAALCAGLSAATAARLGVAAGTFAVTAHGARGAIATRSDLNGWNHP